MSATYARRPGRASSSPRLPKHAPTRPTTPRSKPPTGGYDHAPETVQGVPLLRRQGTVHPRNRDALRPRKPRGRPAQRQALLRRRHARRDVRYQRRALPAQDRTDRRRRPVLAPHPPAASLRPGLAPGLFLPYDSPIREKRPRLPPPARWIPDLSLCLAGGAYVNPNHGPGLGFDPRGEPQTRCPFLRQQ